MDLPKPITLESGRLKGDISAGESDILIFPETFDRTCIRYMDQHQEVGLCGRV